ncbi:unnamed protein product, partial [Amoebophrya sp. A25]|eukprot:GSA25T00024744001.1
MSKMFRLRSTCMCWGVAFCGVWTSLLPIASSAVQPLIHPTERVFDRRFASSVDALAGYRLNAYDAELPRCESLATLLAGSSVVKEAVGGRRVILLVRRDGSQQVNGYTTDNIKKGNNLHVSPGTIIGEVLDVEETTPDGGEEIITTVNTTEFLDPDFVPVVVTSRSPSTRDITDGSTFPAVKDHLVYIRQSLGNNTTDIQEMRSVFASTERYNAIIVEHRLASSEGGSSESGDKNLLPWTLGKAATYTNKVIVRAEQQAHKNSSAPLAEFLVWLKREMLKVGAENVTGCAQEAASASGGGEHTQISKYIYYYFAVSLNNAWTHIKGLAYKMLTQRETHARYQDYNHFGPPYIGLSPVSTQLLHMHRDVLASDYIPYKEAEQRGEIPVVRTAVDEETLHILEAPATSAEEPERPRRTTTTNYTSSRTSRGDHHQQSDASLFDRAANVGVILEAQGHNAWGRTHALYQLSLPQWRHVQRLRDLESKYGEGCGVKDHIAFVPQEGSVEAGDSPLKVVMVADEKPAGDVDVLDVKQADDAPNDSTTASSRESVGLRGGTPVAKDAFLLGSDRMRANQACKSHNYATHYVRHLWHLLQRKREDGPFAVIEIGVLRGAGLAMWADFFGGNAMVHGFDLESRFFWQNRWNLAEKGAFSLLPQTPPASDSDRLSCVVEEAGQIHSFLHEGEAGTATEDGNGSKESVAVGVDESSVEPIKTAADLALQHDKVASANNVVRCPPSASRVPMPAETRRNYDEKASTSAWWGPHLYLFDQTRIFQQILDRVQNSFPKDYPVMLVVDDGKHDSQSAWVTFRTFVGLFPQASTSSSNSGSTGDAEESTPRRVGDPTAATFQSSPRADATRSQSIKDANSWVYVVEDCMCNTFVFMLQDKRPDLYIYKYWNGHNSDLIIIQPKPVDQIHTLLDVDTSSDAVMSSDENEHHQYHDTPPNGIASEF